MTAIVTLIVVAMGGVALAQFRFGGMRDAYQPLPNIAYDGRFTFARIRYHPSPGGFWPGRRPSWIHGYPLAERNLMKIMNEVSLLGAHDDINTVTFDDPELFKYPIAFMWEPGFWTLTDSEASAFRAYLLKGGFAIFEDFDGAQQWAVFEAQMRRVLPDSRLVRLDHSHRIFDSFFRIENIDAIVHPMSHIAPSYYGIFEDNDPAKRLMVVANFDNDVPEYWEWSGQGLFPFDATNDAYKLGVNYLIYGMTH
jgi:hypothetical protein